MSTSVRYALEQFRFLLSRLENRFAEKFYWFLLRKWFGDFRNGKKKRLHLLAAVSRLFQNDLVRRRTLLMGLWCIPLLAQADPVIDPRSVLTLRLRVGETRVLDARHVRGLSSTGSLFDTRLSRDRRRILLRAAARGRATLLLLLRDGTEHRIQLELW